MKEIRREKPRNHLSGSSHKEEMEEPAQRLDSFVLFENKVD